MAIVNGKSGTFNIYTQNQYINGYVKWQETYDDSTYISTNKSTVTIKAYLHRTNVYSDPTYVNGIAGQRIAYFGSETVVDNSNLTLSIAGNSSSSGGEYTKVFEASKEITHDSNGNKNIDLGFYMTNVASGSGANAFKVAKTTSNATLTTIPRYATSNQSENSKTETTITMNWSSDNTIDYIWYSKDNGSKWTGIDVTDGKSGSYTISGLSANTTYNIKTRVRRKDSQLTTDSSALSVTTYNYPYCTSSPNFTIGNSLTLSLYNPLGRTVTINGYAKSNGSLIFSGSSTGTSISGFHDSDSVNKQYASIPNTKSGSYKVVVSYGNIAMTRDNGNTYSIKGNEVPTINNFDYIDNNSDTVAITGNNQHIVQNKSILLARFHSATANYGAGGISKYILEVNGYTREEGSAGSYTLGTVDSSNNVSLTLTAIDTRGLSSSKTITVTMLSYSKPTFTTYLERVNNYEDETHLKVDGSISSVNGKNKIEVLQYRYKLSGGDYGDYYSITDSTEYILNLSKENAYIFEIIIKDTFGTVNVDTVPLGKGVFPLFIDTVLNSVGINCFPQDENSLEVNGLNIFNIIKNLKNSVKTVYTQNGKGIKIEISNYGQSDKIPIVIIGSDNSSTTPVVTIVNVMGTLIGNINLGLERTITRNGNAIHINASQYSNYMIISPLGSEIRTTNSSL